MSVFSHVLLVFNSSTNIIIYSWKDKKFRNLLKRKLNIFHLPVANTSYMETVQRPGTTLGSRAKRKGTEETVIGGEPGSDSLMSSGSSGSSDNRIVKVENVQQNMV